MSVAETGVDQEKGLAELWKGLQCEELLAVPPPPPRREMPLSPQHPQHLSHSALSSHSYSALKKDGQRLSTLMKRGEAVEARPARLVTVYSISLLRFQPPLFTLGRTENFGIICFVCIFTWCLSNVEEELFVGSQSPA